MAILTIGFNPAIDRILECPGFHLGGHQQVRQMARLAAGKAANVSRALAQLGTDSIATGFLGAGELEFFHEQLMSAGPGRILCRFVEVGGQTRENISILDPAGRAETHLRDRGFTVTAEEIALLEQRIEHELKADDFAVFSGSLCDGLNDEFFGALLEKCRRAGARVVVDSSGSPLRAAAGVGLWLLKPNLEELRQLANAEVANDVEAIGRAVAPLRKKAENVLVTRGSSGAVLFTPEGIYSGRIRTQRPAVRTVGCGDHLLAGFISEMGAGRSVERALTVAMAVAMARALSVRMDEFDPGQMEAAFEAVEVERI